MWLDPIKVKSFRTMVLLNELVQGRVFKTILNDDDNILDPLFIEMMSSGLVSIVGDRYKITQKGQKSYDNFMRKYFEFLKAYDVYSYVDLPNAQFAFERYFDFETNEEWESFKSNSQFDDVRIAVGLYKKIDVTEIVFMSFINEGRFDTQRTGWQIDLLSNSIWDEIEKICETAIKPDQIGEEGMDNMIRAGAEIMVNLIKEQNNREEERKKIEQENLRAQEEQVKEVVTITEEIVEPEYVYYEAYYDPFYVPIFWMEPIIIW